MPIIGVRRARAYEAGEGASDGRVVRPVSETCVPRAPCGSGRRLLSATALERKTATSHKTEKTVKTVGARPRRRAMTPAWRRPAASLRRDGEAHLLAGRRHVGDGGAAHVALVALV